jgi:prepilin-type N-terminal cleavage/methylation domain-containing protein
MQAFETSKPSKGGGQTCKINSDIPTKGYSGSGDTTGTGISCVPFLCPLLCPRRKSAKRGEANLAGFTLVEVIVVIVIIAILAAIGVPALTGYIDKAQDKQYRAQARNAMIAVRTVIDEAYADGEFADYSSYYGIEYLTTGHPTYSENTKFWTCYSLSEFLIEAADDREYEFQKRSSGLLGEAVLIDEDYYEKNGYWIFYTVGSSDSTIFNADGFFWVLFPEGAGKSNLPAIMVTYKLDRVDISDMESYDDFAFDGYNPNAGYEVYHTYSN